MTSESAPIVHDTNEEPVETPPAPEHEEGSHEGWEQIRREGEIHLRQLEYVKLGIRDIHDLIEGRNGYCKACVAADVPITEREVIEPKDFRAIIAHAKDKHPKLLPPELR